MKIAQIRDALYDKVPDNFSSIAEARDLLEHYSYKGMLESRDIIHTNNPKAADAYADFIHRYGILLEKWSICLDRFDKCPDRDLTTKERLGLKILQIHRYKYLILLEHARLNRTARTAWDNYNSIFEETVSLAVSVIDTSHEIESMSLASHSSSYQSDETRARPSFSLDLGIVGTLYDVATLCRDPLIRRRAVDVLHSASRQEGVYNSYICAVVAEKVIAIEENVALGESFDSQKDPVSFEVLGSDADQCSRPIKSCHEVPESARLSYAYPRFDTVDKKVVLTIGQTGEMHMNIPLPALTAMLSS
jgi:hypothetical protein